jgi:hypothetical protein
VAPVGLDDLDGRVWVNFGVTNAYYDTLGFVRKVEIVEKSRAVEKAGQ